MSDLLVYGNVDKEGLKYLQSKNLFTSKFDLFSKFSYPNYEETQKEINSIITAQSSLNSFSNSNASKQFMLDADAGLEILFKKQLPKIGLKLTDKYIDQLFKITDDLCALVMQLKNHYQRPRPYQVAWYSKQDLHPFETQSGHSPAFPSGHSCQAHFLCLVIGKHNPNFDAKLKEFANEVAYSRITLGVHYPSDNECGKNIAYALFKMSDVQTYLDSIFV